MEKLQYIQWVLDAEEDGYMTAEEAIEKIRRKLSPLPLIDPVAKKKGRPVGSKNKTAPAPDEIPPTNGTDQ